MITPFSLKVNKTNDSTPSIKINIQGLPQQDGFSFTKNVPYLACKASRAKMGFQRTLNNFFESAMHLQTVLWFNG